MKRLIALLAGLALPAAAQAEPALHSLFSDHAVLQRERPISVWGTADPGERVTVALGNASRTVTAGRDGAWRAELPARLAGGPYTLTATGRGGAAARAEDVMVGDVWLCSGQSNMEWPVSRSLNGEAETGSADDPQVRILTVPQRTALAPQAGLEGVAWRPVSPRTIGDFSAACWFMIRDLRRTENVPMGAIDASWGGTRIRPWMDAAAARASGGAEDAELLALFQRDPAAGARRFGETWARWYRGATGQAEGAEPWRASERLAWRPFPSIGFWEGWGDPAFANFNGYVWARKRFTLTAEEAAAGGTLSLGIVDDLDQTWVNGVAVGSTFGWATPRDYRIPPGLLRAGENEIVVNIGDSWGAGGFQGPADRLRLTLADGTVKPLGEGWEHSAITRQLGSPPRAPWDSHAGLGTIYNAMIAPLGSYGLRGVAWYQGESDVGVRGYDDRLAGMMESWRRQFGNDTLPFLIVSLANFGPPNAEPRASGWAELREEQRQAAGNDPQAALVVAMDLGERGDIHPPNKQDVGRRLARAARALTYRSREPASGPQVVRARRAGDGVLLDFGGVTGRLVTLSGARALAFELCAETQESCRWADAVIEGATVRLAGDGRPATRVRYAWGESPVTNLYDEAPLPVGPFEVRID